MPSFASPQWLLLLPVFAVIAWRLPRAQLWKPLRAVCLILLALALAGPELRWKNPGRDLWVLVDRSASAAESLEPRRAETEKLLEDARRPGDTMHIVDFASAPVVRKPGVAFEPSLSETRLRLAAEYALAQRNPNRASRLLALTDGFSTEDLGGLATRLNEANTPLDLRIALAESPEDFRIGRITAPQRVLPGQGFLLDAEVTGSSDGELPYQILRDGEEIGRSSTTLTGGRGVIRASGRAVQSGAHEYAIRILPANDSRPGNNTASCWIEAVEGPSVLLVTAYQDDPLAEVLRSQSIRVDVVDDFSRLQPGLLSGPRVLILNNVPAHKLPAEFIEALTFFVTEQGGGLLMAGGKFSFGAGGYFQSPIDPLLPVSMELREEHRKLAVAMAIAMDRSGSMSAGVGSGVTKMDLADEGAARSVELLGPSDAVSVIAVDSEPHVFVPLTLVGGKAGEIGAKVRSIRSEGGGIFIYNALRAAWDQLKQSPAGQRHVILFADAADSEEPGEYKNLLAEMTAGGATVSVIGLGSPSDSDAWLLEDIAKLGNGRIFFNADPAQLPALFAQETVAVARSAFIKDPTPVVDAGGWLEIATKPIEWLPKVDGYNLSYLRPQAAASAVSGDEYKAPLVATWQRGAGRTAAVCFPLGGEFSDSVRAWPGASGFEQTLVRWLLPTAPEPEISLRTRVAGSDLIAELQYGEAWAPRFALEPPRLLIAEGASGKAAEIAWEKIEPGRFTARIPLPVSGWVRGVAVAGKARLPFGPVSAGIDPEWDFSPAKLAALRTVSRESGGREIVDLREAWDFDARAGSIPLAPWLLTALLLCFLADVAVTRWGGRG